MPLWNMNGAGAKGVGVANVRETYAVCLPHGASPPAQADLLALAQHEASHPVLDDIQRQHPDVAGDCAFIEVDCPRPAGSPSSTATRPSAGWRP